MGWCWDPRAEEEVCITKDGQEYMRFSQETGKISYCKRAMESFAGEEGMLGRIVDEHDFGQGVESHPQLGESEQAQQEVRSGQVGSTSGF